MRRPRGPWPALAVAGALLSLSAGDAAPAIAPTPALARAAAPPAAAPAPEPSRAPVAAALESAPVTRIEGTDYLGTNDLARLLDATKFWRSDVRKLVLRVGAHRVTLTADNPFAVVDDHTLWLRTAVVSRRGELQVPITLLELLPRDSATVRLVFEPRRALVLRVPRGGVVGSPEVSVGDTLTRVAFPVERVTDVAVAGRSRTHFRLRLGGTFIGLVSDSLPPGSLVRRMAAVPGGAGSVFELEVSPGAAAYRLVREAAAAPPARGGAAGGTVALELVRLWRPGLEDFASEARPARGVRVVVIDPGHGGTDAGVTVAGLVEKDLTLTLARLVRAELARRLALQVVLTREDDRPLTPEQRAEAANRARADLVLSLHFGAVPGTQRSGATAWCPPAAVGTREGRPSPTAPIVVVPWREVALRHAVRSREAAEAVLGALEAAGAGPVRLHERLMRPLLGVNAPGLMLECATLSAIPDRLRVEEPAGLQALAAAIADGVARWARGG